MNHAMVALEKVNGVEIGTMLLQGYMQRSIWNVRPRTPGPLASALAAGISDPRGIQGAIRSELSLEFNMEVTRMAAVTATPNTILVAFEGRSMQFAPSDPVWCIWPGGVPARLLSDPTGALVSFHDAVGHMLMQHWRQAAELLQEARRSLRLRIPVDAFAWQTALAKNMELCVRGQYGELAPRPASRNLYDFEDADWR
jgi:hypothetical protein